MPTIPRLVGVLADVVDLLLAPLIEEEAESLLSVPVPDVELDEEPVPEEPAAPVDELDPVDADPVDAEPVLSASASCVESGTL